MDALRFRLTSMTKVGTILRTPNHNTRGEKNGLCWRINIDDELRKIRRGKWPRKEVEAGLLYIIATSYLLVPRLPAKRRGKGKVLSSHAISQNSIRRS